MLFVRVFQVDSNGLMPVAFNHVVGATSTTQAGVEFQVPGATRDAWRELYRACRSTTQHAQLTWGDSDDRRSIRVMNGLVDFVTGTGDTTDIVTYQACNCCHAFLYVVSAVAQQNGLAQHMSIEKQLYPDGSDPRGPYLLLGVRVMSGGIIDLDAAVIGSTADDWAALESGATRTFLCNGGTWLRIDTTNMVDITLGVHDAVHVELPRVACAAAFAHARRVSAHRAAKWCERVTTEVLARPFPRWRPGERAAVHKLACVLFAKVGGGPATDAPADILEPAIDKVCQHFAADIGGTDRTIIIAYVMDLLGTRA